MKTKIYIAGKITGLEPDHAFELFVKAEIALLKKGYEVVNPMRLKHDHDKSWHSYMRECIKHMVTCDEILMLSNWYDSKGAIIEHTIALFLGIGIKYEHKDISPTNQVE